MLRLGVVVPLALTLLAGVTLAQEQPDSAPDPELVTTLGKHGLIANWMAGYDVAAWHSADEAMKEAPEALRRVNSWFCFARDDGWHAVYGRLDEEGKKFERLFHYLVVSPKEVRKLDDLTADEADVPLARAYRDSMPRLTAKPEARRCRFNPYVRQTEKGVEVWAHPNVAPDWTIVHGITFCWRYSKDGAELKGEEQHGSELYGIKPQKEQPVLIGDPEMPFPGISEMYVVQRFGHLFKEIGVRSRTGVSHLLPVGWTHVVIDDEEAQPSEAEKPAEPEEEGEGGEDSSEDEEE